MLEIFILIILFTIDSFIVSMAYSTKKIKIPNKSLFIIASICSFSLLISLFLSSLISKITMFDLGKYISFIALIILGFYNMFQEEIKGILKYRKKGKFLNIFLDETKADFDNSKILSLKESVFLSIILSLDSLLGGLSIGFMNYNILGVILLSFIANLFFIKSGLLIGEKLIKFNFDTSYVSGIILILLAISKLF